MAYTGPIPPTPAADSTDAQWSSWWAFQTVLTNGRYDDERASRYIVSDRQHAERVEAQAKTAAAIEKHAEAQAGLAAAVALPAALPTRAALAFELLKAHPQATILTNGQLVDGCKKIVEAYASAYPAAVQP